MQISRLMIAAALSLLSAVAYGSLYKWVDTNKPPVSLVAALEKGESLLGDDALRYYPVRVSLYGNAAGDGKGGAWNILYGCSDGSKKHVNVDMHGNARIEERNGPVDRMAAKGRAIDLSDIKQRLEELMNSCEMPLDKVELMDRTLLISSRTREYQVHPELSIGEYGQETLSVIGPKANGVVIEVVLHRKQPPEKLYRRHEAYWGIIEHTYILANGNGFLELSFLYGSAVPSSVVNNMERCFGERAN